MQHLGISIHCLFFYSKMATMIVKENLLIFITLSTKESHKLSKTISRGFERSVHCNECKS